MTKSFIAFVKKEYFHILRDTRTLVILLGMPIALVLIFGYTVTNEFKDASIAIIDEAGDDLSHELIQHLTASGHFQLVELPPNVAALEAAFKAGKVKMGIVIPPNFEAEFYGDKATSLQIITDASEPNYATTLTSYSTQIIRAFQFQRGGNSVIPYQIDVQIRMRYNPELVSAYTFIPGVVALILLLISAMMTSLTIAKEKETGTMDLLLVSPLPPLLIILGKVTPYVVLSFFNALVVLAMGYFIFAVPIHGSLGLLLGLVLLYLMVSLGLGVFISTKSNTQQTAMMFSLFSLMMPTMLLSGFMFPIASMPDVLQCIAAIIPATYFIEIQQAVMLKGAGLSAILKPTFILVSMMVVLFAAAISSFKVISK